MPYMKDIVFLAHKQFFIYFVILMTLNLAVVYSMIIEPYFLTVCLAKY